MVLLASVLLLTVGASPAQAAPGRAYVVNRVSGTVSVIDTATNTLITTIPVGWQPEDAVVTPDGSKVYVISSDRTVSVISTASNTVVATIRLGFIPASLAVTPDGSRLWVSGYSHTFALVDTASNAVVNTGGGPPTSHSITFSPDGTRAYLAASNDTLLVLDAVTLAVVAAVPTGHSPHDVEVSPDGSRVYVADSVGGLRVYDTATNTELARARPGGVSDVALSPDGERLYVTRGYPGGLLVLDAHTLAVLATVPFDLDLLAVDVSATGDRLYVAGMDLSGTPPGRLVVVDTATNAVVATVPVGNYPEDVEVTSVSPPPPPAPVIEGATFYTDGTSARSGVTPGSRISAFTTSAVPGLDYRLVLSRDGCRTVVAVLNTTPRFASAAGVIGTTAGVVPPGTPAGRYQVCFLAPHGTGATITGSATLDVV